MEHEEGRNCLQPEQLMTLALNKAAILHKQNLWNVKSPEEEKVLALTGKVQKLSDANLKLSKFLTEKKAKNNSNNKTKSTKDNKSDNKWAWKKVPPKLGKPWMKKVNEKTYRWCKWHNAWVIHDPNATSGPTACKLRVSQESGSDESTGNARGDTNNTKTTDTEQVHTTQVLVTDLVNSFQQE